MTTQLTKSSWDESIAKVDLIDEIIAKLQADESIKQKEEFLQFCNDIYRQYGIKKPIPMMAFIERYNQMIADGRVTPEARISKIFRKRNVRNQSGVAVISLLTKFWGCPGKCIYCPTFE